MSGVAIGLVLTSAVLHAYWNYLSKQASGGMPFVWLFGVCSITLYGLPVLILLVVDRPHIGAAGFLFIFGSAVLHLAYFLLLNWSYQIGDLSLVYPVARGTGPTLSTLAAIVLLGERPSPLAMGGALLIAVGIFGLAGDPRTLRREGASRAVIYALMTGVTIAMYTLWDKYAVSDLLITPLVLVWLSQVFRLIMLSPFALRRWDDVRQEWHAHARYVLGVALLSPLTYVLVLTALVSNPVSYVAPMRESSTLIGTLMGTQLLMEGHTLRRVLAAGAMMIGVTALGLG